LQNIISLEPELKKAVVITVGKILGGVRNNIMFEDCIMPGTIRTLDSAIQKDIHQQFSHTVKKIAETSCAGPKVIIDTKTLLTYNDPALLIKMLPSLQASNGASNMSEIEWVRC